MGGPYIVSSVNKMLPPPLDRIQLLWTRGLLVLQLFYINTEASRSHETAGPETAALVFAILSFLCVSALFELAVRPLGENQARPGQEEQRLKEKA